MTDWLTYEWEFRGERATFRVDMQYWELLPVLSYSQLIYVCAAPKDSLAKEFNKVEQYRFRMLRHRLIDELEGRAIHVGSVYTDTLRCLYFYAAETDVIQQASAICREYGMLAITCAHASDGVSRWPRTFVNSSVCSFETFRKTFWLSLSMSLQRSKPR